MIETTADDETLTEWTEGFKDSVGTHDVLPEREERVIKAYWAQWDN